MHKQIATSRMPGIILHKQRL